jgi:hypothetical protein
MHDRSVQNRGRSSYQRPNPVPFMILLVIAIITAACTPCRVGGDFGDSAGFTGMRRFAWVKQQDHGTAAPALMQEAARCTARAAAVARV